MGPVGGERTLWAGSVRARSQDCARFGRPEAFFVAAHAAFPLGWSVGLAGIHAFVFGIAARQSHQISPALAEPWGDGCLVDGFVRRGSWCRLLFCGGFLSTHLYPRQQYRSAMKPEAATNPADALDGGIPSQLHIGRHWPAASDVHRSAE